jgi:hypothetical protein
MTSAVEWITYLLWALIVGLGLAIAAYAFRAGIAGRSRSLGFLGTGFLLMSAAAGFLWVGVYATVHDPLVSEVAACAATAAGFGFVLLSVRTRTS